MSLLICTPCYGGQVFAPHFVSCLHLKEQLVRTGLDHDWLIGWNESLVQRARNSMAATFMDTDYRKLLFIDADIDFQPESVARLWNLDADVAVGCYPMKRKDMPLSAWRAGRLVNFDEWPETPFEVDYAGTGFMMIDRKVFEKLRDAFPKGHMEGYAMKNRESFAWFDPRVTPGDKPEARFYASEDYAFCEDWRSLGGTIVADPGIRLGHWGIYRYGEDHVQN